ncbi:hypothetical protein ACIGZJ_23530 [Kitasatospora sp. NPDC052868]|uniref:hypothetical protein n=1 Tax=Kitasatospora sp. NPDC052868 TaxID=3364060 RepID=UPI0037C8C2E4
MKEIIVDPEGTPSIGDLHTVVERGVSREFCSALAQILAEPAIGEFETTFDRADSLPGPAAMPDSIFVKRVDFICEEGINGRRQSGRIISPWMLRQSGAVGGDLLRCGGCDG